MHKRKLLTIIGGLLLVSLACIVTEVSVENTPSPKPLPSATPSSAVDSLQDVRKAVIRIEAQGNFHHLTGDYVSSIGGSGFIIDPEGIAVTNNHVLAGAAVLKVWLDGENEPRNARILGMSECSDLAVIDIEGDGYSYLEWYEGDIEVSVDVYAAGFPLGDPEYTLTRGIISKERANGETSWASVEAVIEHDATINPGHSGGPLVTADGKVVGINYASYEEANQYFALAWREASDVIQVLRTGRNMEWLGLNAKALLLDSSSQGVIWVRSVQAGSPADKIGLQPGDFIVKIAGLDVAPAGTMDTYCNILRTHGSESIIDIEAVRVAGDEISSLKGQINGRELAIVEASPLGVEMTLTVNNASSSEICAVYISDSEADSWGDDWLEDGDVIAAGEQHEFGLSAGAYDVLIKDCDNSTLGTAWGLERDKTIKVGGTGLVSLEVENKSSDEVCYVYISPSSSSSWGEDWLGEQEVISQDQVRVFYLSPGVYNLLSRDCDGEQIQSLDKVSIQGDYSWQISDAEPTPPSTRPTTTSYGVFRIVNEIPGGTTCQLNVWGNATFNVDGSVQAPPGEYGCSVTLGSAHTQLSWSVQLRPGGVCVFTCKQDGDRKFVVPTSNANCIIR